jgi:diadenosine tetraphosphate (Ap4A) HIT family hydrolase
MSALIEFKTKFLVDNLKIYETEYWVWSLRPHQVTMGAGILSLKRQCESFSQLKKDEFADLYNVISIIEGTLKKIFDYDVINYLMLMFFDKQVHYHVLPRYSKKLLLLNQEWSDSAYPGVPKLIGDNTENEILTAVLSKIKTGLILKD